MKNADNWKFTKLTYVLLGILLLVTGIWLGKFLFEEPPEDYEELPMALKVEIWQTYEKALEKQDRERQAETMDLVTLLSEEEVQALREYGYSRYYAGLEEGYSDKYTEETMFAELALP